MEITPKNNKKNKSSSLPSKPIRDMLSRCKGENEHSLFLRAEFSVVLPVRFLLDFCLPF